MLALFLSRGLTRGRMSVNRLCENCHGAVGEDATVSVPYMLGLHSLPEASDVALTGIYHCGMRA